MVCFETFYSSSKAQGLWYKSENIPQDNRSDLSESWHAPEFHRQPYIRLAWWQAVENRHCVRDALDHVLPRSKITKSRIFSFARCSDTQRRSLLWVVTQNHRWAVLAGIQTTHLSAKASLVVTVVSYSHSFPVDGEHWFSSYWWQKHDVIFQVGMCRCAYYSWKEIVVKPFKHNFGIFCLAWHRKDAAIASVHRESNPFVQTRLPHCARLTASSLLIFN